jgi:HEAT repeat protein
MAADFDSNTLKTEVPASQPASSMSNSNRDVQRDLLGNASPSSINNQLIRLHHVLINGEPRSQVAVIQTLIKNGDPTSIDLIIARGCENPEPYVRTAAVMNIARIRSDRSYDAMIQALTDENAKVRWAAVSGLKGTTDPEAINGILAYSLPDPDPTVRKAALDSLLASQATGKVLQNKDLKALASKINALIIEQNSQT